MQIFQFIVHGVWIAFALHLFLRVLRQEQMINGLVVGIHHLKQKLAMPVMVFSTNIGGAQVRVESMFMKADDADKSFKIAIKDRKGNPAQVDGAPKWAVSDESLASVVAAEDGMSAVLSLKGGVGSFMLQVSADADLGEGVKPLLGELAIDVVAAEAVAIEISEA